MLFFISCNKAKETGLYEKKLSEIDSLNTYRAIEQYICKSDSLYRKFTLKKVQDIQCKSCDTTFKDLARKHNIDFSYVKADFDNNGYTDLLATGENKTYTNENYDPDLLVEFSKDFNAFVVMNFGNGNLKIHDLTDGRFYGIIPKVEFLNSKNYLFIYKRTQDFYHKTYVDKESKLTFKYDAFIEYNSNPKKYLIEKIEYSASGCFGMCPVFGLSINEDGSAEFLAKTYNYTEEWQKGKLMSGTYKTIINNEQIREITNLLDYIDFPNLKNEYFVSWTDDQTGTFKITYNNGKVKTIKDYGLQGTYGLKKMHELLFNLRVNQKWKQ